jgi:hypothetical protein
MVSCFVSPGSFVSTPANAMAQVDVRTSNQMRVHILNGRFISPKATNN